MPPLITVRHFNPSLHMGFGYAAERSMSQDEGAARLYLFGSHDEPSKYILWPRTPEAERVVAAACECECLKAIAFQPYPLSLAEAAVYDNDFMCRPALPSDSPLAARLMNALQATQENL